MFMNQFATNSYSDASVRSYNVCFKDKQVKLTKPVNKKFICVVCDKLMSNPIQSGEGNLACKDCYENKKYSLSDKSICPLDGEKLRFEAFEDKMIYREINKLEVKCAFEPDCAWVGALSDIDIHERKDCKYSKTNCEYCKLEVLNYEYHDHIKKQCQKHEEECENCGKSVIVAELQKHNLGCNGSIKCPYGCNKDLKKSMITEHLENCEKLNSGCACPYSIMGCPGTSEDEDIKKHMAAHANDPIYIVKEFIRIKSENEKLHERIEDGQNKIKELYDEQLKFKQTMDNSMKQLQSVMCELDKKRNYLHKNREILEEKLEQFECHFSVDYEKEISELTELTKQLSPVAPTSAPDLRSLKKLNDTTTRLNHIEKEVAMLNANLADAELSMQLIENTKTDGRQVWRIDNYQYRNRQAEQGNIKALHSAPCFTSPNGYKFCIRVYPNGDGMGKNTHLSIYFVLMKNHYDSLLEWPFYRKVTFKVLNHKDVSKSKKETFISDKTSSSFQKPKRDMNIAAGCPKFLSKDALFNDGYLIDDSIFIETIVEEVDVRTQQC